MTFCLGMKFRDGIVGIADTRITSGNEFLTAKKTFVIQRKNHAMFIMTSGLRSVRDKAITYFREVIDESDRDFDKLYKAVNAFGTQVKKVSQEDKKSILESGLKFNLHALVGGQLEKDDQHKLFLLYPEGNWVEVGEMCPYFVIGTGGYGKPLLDRILTYSTSLETAIKTGFLAFDATRTSSNDVDYPLDFVIYKKGSFKILEHRLLREDMTDVSKYWQEIIIGAVNQLPHNWISPILSGNDAD